MSRKRGEWSRTNVELENKVERTVPSEPRRDMLRSAHWGQFALPAQRQSWLEGVDMTDARLQR